MPPGDSIIRILRYAENNGSGGKLASAILSRDERARKGRGRIWRDPENGKRGGGKTGSESAEREEKREEKRRYDEPLPSFDCRAGYGALRNAETKPGDGNARRLFCEEQRRGSPRRRASSSFSPGPSPPPPPGRGVAARRFK